MHRVSLRKRDGGVFAYTYDPLNRLVIKETPGALANVRYSYDLRGLQTEARFTATDLGVRNVYDGFGRMVSTTTKMGGSSRTVSHGFDREGRRIELGFPDGGKFRTVRDGLGRTASVHPRALGSADPSMVAFTYDAGLRLYYFARRNAERNPLTPLRPRRP